MGTHCISLQVRFQGRDSSGRPILVVRLTKACQECHGEQAEQVAEAVLSQVWEPAQRPVEWYPPQAIAVA